MVDIPDVLARKRDGEELTQSDFRLICNGINTAHPAQLGAFVMACTINGLSEKETALLTEAMLYSGASFKPEKGRVDKHSTGGVGDKMSIILAPALAAAGATVPMLAGRGLAHTGGTIDKLESIPGFNTGLTMEEMEASHCFISRQTDEIAPADSALYATRDITGTVPQIGLITSSIISKKAAEGLEKLVLDVKCGRAAFMKTEKDARELAESMVKAGKSLNIDVCAQITRMDHPIGRYVGNAHEIFECIQCLQGHGPDDTMELVYMQADALGYDIRPHIKDGTALGEFRDMCVRQGVDDMVADMLITDPWSVLPKAELEMKIHSSESGYITDIDALLIGECMCRLGAGRTGQEATLDHSIGLEIIFPVGSYVKEGECIAVLNIPSGADTNQFMMMHEAFKFGSIQPKYEPRLIDTVK
jgi:pyrimidine-nucleoside phosphorylase